MNRTIGIDLGTSNSAGVVLKDGKMRLVPAAEGETRHGKMFPSIVVFKPDGEVIVGKEAFQYSHIYPERTVRWIKRHMGTNHNLAFDGDTYTPQDISALILGKIKRDAENFLGEKIEKAVITAPAYFNNNQRNATKAAGELAGFEVIRVVSEPTAAALAYGLNLGSQNLKAAVLDLGAGTFDITIIQISKGLFSVFSTSGDTLLGGKDMDDILLQRLGEEIRMDHSDMALSQRDMAVLRDAAEEAKIKLSTSETVTINPKLPSLDEKYKLNFRLSRSHLEEMLQRVLSRVDEPMKRALDDSGLSTGDIDRLILVGGPTSMPFVQRHISDFFGIHPEKGIDPFSVVATGAFLQASIIEGEIRDRLLLDVTPLSLGVETSGGVFTRLIKRNTTIPTEARRVFATAENGQTMMLIHVLQGEREMAKGNVSLGLLRIDGIPPTPRFEEEVEVTFRIDADGIMQVSAEILSSGEMTSVTIEGFTDFSEEDLTRMIIDATINDSFDTSYRDAAEVMKNAEAILYGARDILQKFDSRLTRQRSREIVKLLDRLEHSLHVNDLRTAKRLTEEVKEFTENIQSMSRKIDQMKLLSSRLGVQQNLTIEKIFDPRGRIDGSSIREIDAEMKKLKETITLLEVYQERD